MAITMSARRYHRLKDKIEAKLGDGAHRGSKFSPDPSGNFYVCRQILGSTARNFISELLIRDYLVLLKKARKNRPFAVVSDGSRKLNLEIWHLMPAKFSKTEPNKAINGNLQLTKSRS